MSSAFGLCAACVHQRVVGNTRGSRFSLCQRSRSDDRFPRYPRMPVAACSGFVPLDPAPAGVEREGPRGPQPVRPGR